MDTPSRRGIELDLPIDIPSPVFLRNDCEIERDVSLPRHQVFQVKDLKKFGAQVFLPGAGFSLGSRGIPAGSQEGLLGIGGWGVEGKEEAQRKD
jgi:hypothetical protein